MSEIRPAIKKSVRLNITVKTVGACNLSCRYCDADISSKDKMSFEVLAYMTKKALDKGDAVRFTWHGGEPLLLGLEFYKKAFLLQQRYRSSHQKIYNSIQTNGTKLNKEWIKFFNNLNFVIGISIDGPEQLHDKNRIYRNGTGSFNEVMSSISLLQELEAGWGALMVVTEDTINFDKRQLFDFFIENGIKYLGFLCQNPIITSQNPPINRELTSFLPKHKFVNFLCHLFDMYMELDDPEVHIREFDSIIRLLLGGNPSKCTYIENCIGNYFTVEKNGDIYPCDEFMFDSEHRFGNILQDDFEIIKESLKIKKLKNKYQMQIQTYGCQNCRWMAICHGGCPKDRVVHSCLYGNRPNHKCWNSILINHIYSQISKNKALTESNLLKIKADNSFF